MTAVGPALAHAMAVGAGATPASEVAFYVVGLPATKGSSRGLPFHRANGKLGVRVINDNPRGKPWQAEVKAAALEQLGARGIMTGPVAIDMVFYMPRPKGHYGTGRNRAALKPSAPRFPTTKPDADKMVRPIKDALSKGVLYIDDAQVVDLNARKRYADPLSPLAGRIGVVVEVRAL